MTVGEFIAQETEGASVVVDFGSGKYESSASVHASVPRVICIEVFTDYTRDNKEKRFETVDADFRCYQFHVAPGDMDCALFADSLEHVTKEDGLNLIGRVQKAFRKCVVFTPLGLHPQESGGEWEDGNPFQKHECGWTPSEFADLGFRVIVDPAYHGAKGGAIFAVWERADG